MSSPTVSAALLPRELLRLADESAWSAGVLVVAAHADDETIGAGGLLPHLPLLEIVHVTDAAPRERCWWGSPEPASREEYAGVRRCELVAALALAGIADERLRCLGREDQRASFGLAALAREIERVIGDTAPGVVLTHPYEGGHPDHDAAAFAVHAARALREREGLCAPAIVEFTSYFARGDGIATGEFLPVRGCEAVDVPLSAEDRERKEAMIGCFGSQRETLAQFAVDQTERFRRAPEYDFTRPPHGGALHYERFDWGITGPEWRALAAEALETLGMGGAVAC